MRTTSIIAFAQRNFRLVIAWAGAMLVLVVMNFNLNKTTVTFLGVAESRESVISFERPVQIKRIHVLPGEKVTKGQLLVELSQAELEIEFSQMQTRLNSLEAEKSMNAVFVDQKESQEVAMPNPMDEEIKGLKEQIEILERSSNNSYIFADIDGMVGSIHFKAGEKAPPFSPVLTVSSVTPISVQGFIHENLHHQVQLGSRVQITSETSRDKRIYGTVTSIGARIVPFPERLLKYPNMKIWGKEILVSIDSRNEFLLGEKVQIRQNDEGVTRVVDLDKSAMLPPKDQARIDEIKQEVEK